MSPGSHQVRSPGRVTWPSLQKGLTFAMLGGVWTPPWVFFRVARKRRRAAPPGFHLPITIFRIFSSTCVKVSILSHARSGHQVRSWPHYTKLNDRATAIMFEEKLWNFRNIMKSSVPTNEYLGFFLYMWPQVRSFSWPPHYKSMGKK